jgi:hypothetical protein
MAYSPILEHYYNNYSKLSKPERKVYSKLRDIFVDYLFASPLNVIDVNLLKTDLKQLSVLMREVVVNSGKPSSSVSILEEGTNDSLHDDVIKLNGTNKGTSKDLKDLKESKESKESKKIISAIIDANNY